jgi:hypothetical protein
VSVLEQEAEEKGEVTAMDHSLQNCEVARRLGAGDRPQIAAGGESDE